MAALAITIAWHMDILLLDPGLTLLNETVFVQLASVLMKSINWLNIMKWLATICRLMTWTMIIYFCHSVYWLYETWDHMDDQLWQKLIAEGILISWFGTMPLVYYMWHPFTIMIKKHGVRTHHRSKKLTEISESVGNIWLWVMNYFFLTMRWDTRV